MHVGTTSNGGAVTLRSAAGIATAQRLRRLARSTAYAVLVIALVAPLPARGLAAVSLGGWLHHSPDDISGFLTLTGNDVVTNVTLPFTFSVEGVGYTTLTLSTNGWIELGGNTAGNSDETNDCLPTAAHTNPFLAYYWDDMRTINTAIRYGTVGAAGSRVFIVDVDFENDNANNHDMTMQVQLHEGSNLIMVKYLESQAEANGQTATIGFQGAGGASATTVQPLTCNGKILDDNRVDEGWSADVGRAGLVTLAAATAHSPDDLPGGFFTLTGNDGTANVTLPFSVTIEGTSYNTLALSTNGWLEIGGNTAGNSDPSNDCLPTSAHTNPFIAAYWDDLNPFGTNIRYGTVGASPNRVFIADYEVDLVSGVEGQDDLRFQVQIHERSNLVSVRYRDLQNNANGQGATIGAQGAGGASAAAYPLTCNAKILDDNDSQREGWSVHPRADGPFALHGVMAHSPDDISGFTTLSGNDSVQTVTLPFGVTIDGTSYTTVAVSTNGWLEFGGNTSGNSDPSNDCLPTAAHTNPFLAAYWDDMVPINTNVRYGTIGSAGGRVFIVDMDLENNNAGNNDMYVQVQVHERSNVITVKHVASQPAANGQTATVGFQSAGGASATASPLTCNGKIFDDNRPHAGWSVAPLPICGNGILEPFEACDLGGANGSATSCCTATCDFRASAAECRPVAGDCDVAESCTGNAAACPTDGFLSGNECRAAADVCDVAESCSGSGPSCPADGVRANDFVCRPSAGICDVDDTCDGVDVACPADAFEPSTTECRAAAGVCDVAESCTGGGVECPADDFASASTVCRASADVCDAVETCTGVAADCPGDAFQPSSVECRASADVCDVAEGCTGAGPSCPADDFQPSTTECRASAGVCDVAETCTGTGAACPADALQPSSTVCRAAADVCDVTESCTGSSVDCPADALESSSTVCRPTAGVCDVAESCTGTGVGCPADVFEPTTLECRASAGDCDVAEQCSGTSADCPTDAFAPPTTECRADAGDCDVADNCDGAGPTCPPDALEPDGTGCSDGMTCTIDDACVAGVCVGDSMTCGDGVVQGSCGEACDDGNNTSNDGCSAGCQLEPGIACGATPLAGCRQPFVPGTAKLIIKNKPTDTSDLLVWKWVKGERTTFSELGDPLVDTSYQLCVYDQTGVVLDAHAPAGGLCDGKPCWKVLGLKGYKYKDKLLTPDGLLQILVKEGADGKAKVLVKGKGINLDDPDLLALAQPITVQLSHSDGLCWEAVYSAPPTKQAADQFKDKAD